MDHGGMDHSGMGHGATAGYPYTVTLTSRSTDEVLFFTLSEDGTLAFDRSFPAGDGPYHAHANHDGSAILIPDQRGDAVSILDAETRAIVRSVDAAAPAGPLSQPHSPAPAMDGTRFFVTSSNLNGAWTPDFLFMAPGDGDRPLLGAGSFGNLAAFSPTGELLGVVQLGAYPSGLEPVMLPTSGHDGMDHGWTTGGWTTGGWTTGGWTTTTEKTSRPIRSPLLGERARVRGSVVTERRGHPKDLRPLTGPPPWGEGTPLSRPGRNASTPPARTASPA